MTQVASTSIIQGGYAAAALPPRVREEAPRAEAPPPAAIAVPAGLGPGMGYIPVLQEPTVDVRA
jgi:hypothetical protein